MTHLGNWQGCAEVLLCPVETGEGLRLSWSKTVDAASKQKHHKSGLRFKRTNTRLSKISLACFSNRQQLEYRYAVCDTEYLVENAKHNSLT